MTTAEIGGRSGVLESVVAEKTGVRRKYVCLPDEDRVDYEDEDSSSMSASGACATLLEDCSNAAT